MAWEEMQIAKFKSIGIVVVRTKLSALPVQLRKYSYWTENEIMDYGLESNLI